MSSSAPVAVNVNRKVMDMFVGQRVRLIGKVSVASLSSGDPNNVVVMSPDGIEVKIRMTSAQYNSSLRGSANNSGIAAAIAVCVVGRVENDMSISLDANGSIVELGSGESMDMAAYNEAINCQFRKEFNHLFTNTKNNMNNPTTTTTYS